MEWAIAFAIPSISDELTFMVDGERGVQLGDLITLAGLPTLTPVSTKVPRPTVTEQPTRTPAPTPVQLTMTLARGGNLRSGPGTDYGVINEITSNDTILVIAQRDVQGERWYQVKQGVKTGWMSSRLFDTDSTQLDTLPVHKQLIPPPPTATPAPTAKPQPAAQPAPSSNSGQRIGAICNDGSRSSATGRGACSRHGGVSYWLLAP